MEKNNQQETALKIISRNGGEILTDEERKDFGEADEIVEVGDENGL